MGTAKPLNAFWSILLPVAGIYALLVLFVFVSQSRMIFYPEIPSREIMMTPDRIGLVYEPVQLVTDDGIKLDAWFMPREHARGVLLFFHGNAGNISHRLDSLQLFHDLGLAVLIFDYRGYGRSEGRISEQGTYRDAEAAWRYLAEERKIPVRDIVLFGRSLGAAVAAQLATRHTPGALMIESAFTSVPDMAADIYPFLPVRWLARFQYATGEYLASVSCPVLVVHSRDDEIIPFKHGQRLFELAKEPKQWLPIRGGHNDGFIVSGRSYVDGFNSFLTAHLGR